MLRAMTRRIPAAAAIAAALALAGCSAAPVPPGGTPDAGIQKYFNGTATVADIADTLGCTGYSPSAETAPFAAEWGECQFDGTPVQAYAFATADDYASMLDVVRGLGITESQLVVIGLFAFAPRDQNQLSALQAAAAQFQG